MSKLIDLDGLKVFKEHLDKEYELTQATDTDLGGVLSAHNSDSTWLEKFNGATSGTQSEVYVDADGHMWVGVDETYLTNKDGFLTLKDDAINGDVPYASGENAGVIKLAETPDAAVELNMAPIINIRDASADTWYGYTSGIDKDVYGVAIDRNQFEVNAEAGLSIRVATEDEIAMLF